MNLKLFLIAFLIYQIEARKIENDLKNYEIQNVDLKLPPIVDEIENNDCKLHCKYNWYIEKYEDEEECFKARCMTVSLKEKKRRIR